MYPANPPARDAGDAVDPAAGADLVPEADPATADQDLGPSPDLSRTRPRTRRPSPSPSPSQGLLPGLDPGPNLDLEVTPLHLKEDPGQDLKASRSQQQKMEGDPHSAAATGMF